MQPMNTINYGLINGGFGFFAPYKGVFSKRHFSQAPRAVLPTNVACDGEKRRKSASFLAFNKHWKQSKKLTHKKPLEVEGRTYAKSSAKAITNDDILSLKDSSVEDGKKEANIAVKEGQLPNTKEKKKQQPKIKKPQKKSVATSEEPVPEESFRKASKPKKSKSSDSALGTPASEVIKKLLILSDQS